MTAMPRGASIRVDLWRYRLPLSAPLVFGETVMEAREGLLLQWQRPGRPDIWSEIAPLPGFSREVLDQCVEECRQVFSGGAPGAPARLRAQWSPAVRFGIESGWLQLHRELPPPGRVEVCRLIGRGERIGDDLNTGPVCVKVKVGGPDLASDASRVREVLQAAGSRTRLRLDANRAWTLAQTESFCALIPSERIEYIEEPLREGLSYRGWSERIGVPFAWDETLRECPRKRLDMPGLAAVVVKPMLTGLAAARRQVARAQRRGLNAVLSSSYESPLGLEFLSRMAVHWQLPGPQGLDTGGIFAVALRRPGERHEPTAAMSVNGSAASPWHLGRLA